MCCECGQLYCGECFVVEKMGQLANDSKLPNLPCSEWRPSRGLERAAPAAGCPVAWSEKKQKKHAIGAVHPRAEVRHWGPAGLHRGSAVVPPRRRPGIRRGAAQPRDDAPDWHRDRAGPRRGSPVVPSRRRPGPCPSAVQPRVDVRVLRRRPAGPHRGSPARLFRLAADQGHARAQHALGSMYKHGTGVPQDYVEAVRLLTLARDQGLKPAQGSLGKLTARCLAAAAHLDDRLKAVVQRRTPLAAGRDRGADRRPELRSRRSPWQPSNCCARSAHTAMSIVQHHRITIISRINFVLRG